MVPRSTGDVARSESPLTDRLIRLTRALAVIAVACVAAIISYQHAYELVSTHGEHGRTARLLQLTVDGRGDRTYYERSRRRSPTCHRLGENSRIRASVIAS